MNSRPIALLVTTALLLCASAQVQAEQPASGVGLFGGIASHAMNPQPQVGTAADYSSSGVSLGVDYQFGLTDSFSINPFLMSTAERVSGGVTDSASGHGILGVEARYWITNEYFLGAHIGSYSEVLQPNSSNVSTSASGGGFGLTAGWENNARNSTFNGMFMMLQMDKAKIRYDGSDVELSSLRLQIGYRWK